MKNIQPLHFLLGGAGLLLLGTFLPWQTISVESSIGGIASTGGSVSGFEDWRGKLIALLAVAIGASPFVKLPGKEKLISTIALGCAVLAAVLTLWLFILVLNAGPSGELVAQAKTLGIKLPDVSIGFGIFIAIIGVAAAGWGAYNIWKVIPNPASGASPPATPSGPPSAPPGPPPA